MSMENLSAILWRERNLLESLLYRLEVEQLVLDSGKTRWLLQAANDVEQVVITIRQTELLSAVASDEVAASVGLEHNTSLRDLAADVEGPRRQVLPEHSDAFALIPSDIAALSATTSATIPPGTRAA